MILQTFFWFSLGLSVMLFAWGFQQMRYGITPLDAYIGVFKVVTGLILFGLLFIAFAVGAMASPRDIFILQMESAFGMSPGAKKPVMQCQCSVEYLGTQARGGNIYAVLIKKLD